MNFQFHLFSIATEDPLSLNIRFVVQYHETCAHALLVKECHLQWKSAEFVKPQVQTLLQTSLYPTLM